MSKSSIISNAIKRSNDKQNLSTDSTLEQLLADNPYHRIKSFVFDSSLISIVLSLLIVLITFWDLYRESFRKAKNYLSAEQNWMLFIHSVLTIYCQISLRWDVFFCSIKRIKHSNLVFNSYLFIVLLVIDFVFITGVILYYYPKRGVTFWTNIILIIFLLRFGLQIVVLNAIKIAKRESDDIQIKRLIQKAVQKLRSRK